MSKNLEVKKINDGKLKTLIITNNSKNKKFSLNNVKTIFKKIIQKNNLEGKNIQIDLKNIQRAIQIKDFDKEYDDEKIDYYYSNKMKNYQNFTEFNEIIFRIYE